MLEKTKVMHMRLRSIASFWVQMAVRPAQLCSWRAHCDTGLLLKLHPLDGLTNFLPSIKWMPSMLLPQARCVTSTLSMA